MFGDTTGDVMLYALVGNVDQVRNVLKFDRIHSYKAHSMGCNAISAVTIYKEDLTNKWSISICSGGDDQSLTYGHFTITQENNISNQSSFEVDTEFLISRQGAAGSAIKGVHLLKSTTATTTDNVSLEVVTVGYDQRLTLWDITHPFSPMQVASEKNSMGEVKWVGSQVVFVSDVAALEVAQIIEDKTPTLCCVVVGEGHQLCLLKGFYKGLS